MRTVPGTRLVLPEPLIAWVLVVVGAVGLVVGTLCAMRVRRSVNAEGGWIESLFRSGSSTLGILLHDYDEPDKALMAAGLILRPVLGAVMLWGIAGVAWR
ncbi:MAG: hypothetical protein KIS66_04045 [Fimbriimonadaceae bacterium]|nr:hypothetical protein [Fimbriimonadaceae bacterium]